MNKFDKYAPYGAVKLAKHRKGKIILLDEFPNLVTLSARNSILDTMFNGATQVTTWYMGLIDNTGYTAIQANDTMASHAGWTELVDYTGATRMVWDPGAATSQIVVNGTQVTFAITTTMSVRGIFITSGSAKSGTTGLLWSMALATAPISLENGEELKVTYTVGG